MTTTLPPTVPDKAARQAEGRSPAAAQPPRSLLPWSALLAVAIWGMSFVATRIALEAFTPVGLVVTRMLVGALLLLLVLARRGGPLLPARADRAHCLLLGLILGGHLLIQTIGLQYTTAVNTGWIVALIPALIAFGSHFVLRQPLARTGWLGLALATAGVALVTSVAPADLEHAGFGDLLQLSSTFTWATYTLLAPGVVGRNGSLRVSVAAMGVAALLLCAAVPWQGVLRETPLGAASLGEDAASAGSASSAEVPLPGDASSAEESLSGLASLDTRALLATAYLAVLASGLGYLLWGRALTTHGATRAGATLYVEPLFTLAAAQLLLEEPVGSHTLAGGALVLLGVWIVGRAAREKA